MPDKLAEEVVGRIFPNLGKPKADPNAPPKMQTPETLAQQMASDPIQGWVQALVDQKRLIGR